MWHYVNPYYYGVLVSDGVELNVLRKGWLVFVFFYIYSHGPQKMLVSLCLLLHIQPWSAVTSLLHLGRCAKQKLKSERDKNKEVVAPCCALWSLVRCQYCIDVAVRCMHCIAAVLHYTALHWAVSTFGAITSFSPCLCVCLFVNIDGAYLEYVLF